MKLAVRIILVVTVFLVIGAAVNVGVAWGSAAWPFSRSWSEASGVRAFPPTGGAVGNLLWIRTWRTWSSTEVFVMRFHDETIGFHLSYDPQQHAEWDTLADVAPDWVITWSKAHLFVDERVQYDDAVLISHGWPLASMWHELRRETSNWTTAPQGRSDAPLSARPDSVHLPYRPLWPGFAINTLLYIGIAAVVWYVPGVLRRGARRCRGLCEHCGYSRAGLAEGAICPECGDVR